MDDAEKTVAKLVKHLVKLREERGISVYRIAQDTGLSPSGIRHMEKGRANPTLYFLLRVADYLEADLPKILAEIRGASLSKPDR